jgi:hypothetical protein
MAKQTYEAYEELIPEGEQLEMPDYLERVRVAGLVPRRWLDARHAGFIQVLRNEAGTVVVQRAPAEQEGMVL